MFVKVPRREKITGVILAGGRARRMGGRDKGLEWFAGRPLVDWVIDALIPQVSEVMINANRNRAIYAVRGHRVIADEIEGFQGPLAGVASAMATVTTPWIATLPCDSPFPAPDLVERLCAALTGEGAEIAVAADGNRIQPVYALIPIALASSLREFLLSGERRIGLWYAQHQIAVADLSDCPEGFANINSAADLQLLERKLRK